MTHRPNHLLRSLVLVAGIAFVGIAQAAKPPILDKEALVTLLKEDCKTPGLPHCHQIETKWNLVAGQTKFTVNAIPTAPDIYFLDRSDPSNEMQAPVLHLINGGTNPLSKGSFSNLGGWPLKVNDFLFLVGIENLENADGSRTPHALIYIPYTTTFPRPKGVLYTLYVVHILDKASDCFNEQTAIAQRFCVALYDLKEKWEQHVPPAELNKFAHDLATELLPHVFDGIAKPGNTSLVGDPLDIALGWITTVGLHNGIIHGNLGGG